MGRLLRWVTATHTLRYRTHYHSLGGGHLYQDRFKSFAIGDYAHFFTVCRYVERNPLRANLVKRAADWPHGSLYRWKSGKDEPKLLSPWPVRRLPGWEERVQADALTEPRNGPKSSLSDMGYTTRCGRLADLASDRSQLPQNDHSEHSKLPPSRFSPQQNTSVTSQMFYFASSSLPIPMRIWGALASKSSKNWSISFFEKSANSPTQ